MPVAVLSNFSGCIVIRCFVWCALVLRSHLSMSWLEFLKKDCQRPSTTMQEAIIPPLLYYIYISLYIYSTFLKHIHLRLRAPYRLSTTRHTATSLRFLQTLRGRYDWTEDEMQHEWECAKTNPQAVWSKDDYGVAVVSLLKATNASNTRTLSHSNAVRRTSAADDDDDLEGTFSRSLT